MAGAFYQGYAVREKGWTRENVSNGVIDSVVGIGVLGLISLMIMVTSATALRGADLKTLTDVAGQLEPLLGQKASVMFAMGILAGACSSLLVNALIGGTVFSDGLGFDASIKEPWPKALTVACLGFGMVTAIAMTWTSFSKVTMIVTAQAMTVVALPMIAFGMLALAWNLEKSFYRVYYRIFAVFTFFLTIFFAVRMVWSLWEKAIG
ncbi:divalent metal cation transporter [Roseiconus lacunae]|uniref:divalent metal cation transporter n=1 Tax=Roseiconus lacunae TaxID=2605694 RepID=UPI003F52F0BB